MFAPQLKRPNESEVDADIKRELANINRWSTPMPDETMQDRIRHLKHIEACVNRALQKTDK